MSIDRPFRRCCRPNLSGSYTESGHLDYVELPGYAKDPHHYLRAQVVIESDLQELCRYIEPADQNEDAFSYQIHALLIRACIEIEANFKAILTENGYAGSGNWTMADYSKVNASHRLSDYEVKVPNWWGEHSVRRPFAAWANSDPLPWYQAYNRTKHDRHSRFPEAKFKHLIDAVTGLAAVLASQFHTHDFDPVVTIVGGGTVDGFEYLGPSQFAFRPPQDWPIDKRYSTNNVALRKMSEPCQNYPYE